jgi:hypothetical protein
MGVESNAMQFYPEASAPERAVHPGVFPRRNGVLDLSTMNGPGFSYRVDEIARVLPSPRCARRLKPPTVCATISSTHPPPIAKPARAHDFLLRVELHALAPLNVEVAEK